MLTKHKHLSDIDKDCTLTPAQKNIERIILANHISKDKSDEAIRLLNDMNEALKSRQHWAIDHYTTYLSQRANELIKDLSTDKG